MSVRAVRPKVSLHTYFHSDFVVGGGALASFQWEKGSPEVPGPVFLPVSSVLLLYVCPTWCFLFPRPAPAVARVESPTDETRPRGDQGTGGRGRLVRTGGGAGDECPRKKDGDQHVCSLHSESGKDSTMLGGS